MTNSPAHIFSDSEVISYAKIAHGNASTSAITVKTTSQDATAALTSKCTDKTNNKVAKQADDKFNDKIASQVTKEVEVEINSKATNKVDAETTPEDVIEVELKIAPTKDLPTIKSIISECTSENVQINIKQKTPAHKKLKAFLAPYPQYLVINANLMTIWISLSPSIANLKKHNGTADSLKTATKQRKRKLVSRELRLYKNCTIEIC